MELRSSLSAGFGVDFVAGRYTPAPMASAQSTPRSTRRFRPLAALGWLVYQLAYALALVLAAPVLLLQKGGFGHYLRTLSGRTTWRLPEVGDDTRPRLWIHAVSVGEALVASTLVRALPDDLPLVITTVTPTGQEQARKLADRLGDRAMAAYLPFDFGPLLRRFLRRTRPAALVLVEGDYWPRLLAEARQCGLPVVVVNGRSSDRAFRRQQRLGAWNGLFYGAVARFGVQTGDDAERLAGLGVDPDRVRVTGNLKFDTDPPHELPELEGWLRELAAARPILVAGSTMEGEEEKVLDAFERLLHGADPVQRPVPAVLVLAPRHPERWEAVARRLADRLADRRAVRRSTSGPGADTEGPASETERPDIVLLDSLGELARVYALASAAFVGGTLVATGGHNPLEPARYGVATAVGPSMHNFREVARTFDRADAWGRVADAAELASLWAAWLTEPERARAVGDRASALVSAGRGAARRSVQWIAPVLEPALGAVLVEPDDGADNEADNRAEDRP